ncbi:MAG: serine protease [SAR324 cluster bacterium]|nr:serine protease [SAR324 cluster bacterium]
MNRNPLQIFLVIFLGFFLATDLMAAEINYKEVYQKASLGVVMVYGTDGKVGSTGTGSIIEKSGLILTNTHVVSNKGKLWDQQFVFLKPAKMTGNNKKDLKQGYQVKVIATNPKYDLAILQMIDPPDNLTALPLSDLKNVGIGEPTIAIGHPGGGALWSLTTGRLSASFRDYGDVQGWGVFQTETSLNPGNSGGPLLDGAGNIIGINTFIIRKNAGGLALTGLNFAVMATTATGWIKTILGRLPGDSELPGDRLASKPSVREIEKARAQKPTADKLAKATLEVSSSKTQERPLPVANVRPVERFKTLEKSGKVYKPTAFERFAAEEEKAFGDFGATEQSEFEKYQQQGR